MNIPNICVLATHICRILFKKEIKEFFFILINLKCQYFTFASNKIIHQPSFLQYLDLEAIKPYPLKLCMV